MSSSIDEAIIEGFICPICIKSFKTARVLQAHFKTTHNATSPTDYVVPTRSMSRTHRSSIPTASFAFYEQYGSAQPLGQSRSLMSELTALRRSRINRDAMETTSLLIRTEKLFNCPYSTRAERREYEQSVVPWIDSDFVNLCPSCGKAFGLGLEPSYDLDLNSKDSSRIAANSSGQNRLNNIASKGKIQLTRITNAILDYDPVYRRKHHCRLCGHVLCADCSLFLSRVGGMQMLEWVAKQSFDKAPTDVQSQNLPETETSLTELLTCFSDSPAPFDLARGDTEVQFLRVCAVCKQMLEKKILSFAGQHSTSPIVQLHNDLRQLMAKVDESFPMYTEIAESLHSGEQRYPLEMARSMRHDLLEMLQQIDQIRQRFDNLASVKPSAVHQSEQIPQANLATVRLIRNISVFTRNFLQNKLPPLKALPTLHQYGSLAAQRQDELTARWAEEDRAIARLEKRIGDQTKTKTNQQINVRHSSEDPIIRLGKIAEQIDETSGQLIRAQTAGSTSLAANLSRELEKLENQFKQLSASLQATCDQT